MSVGEFKWNLEVTFSQNIDGFCFTVRPDSEQFGHQMFPVTIHFKKTTEPDYVRENFPENREDSFKINERRDSGLCYWPTGSQTSRQEIEGFIPLFRKQGKTVGIQDI